MTTKTQEGQKQVPQKLVTWNKWLAMLHFVQGCAVLLLSTGKTFPISTNYLSVDPLQTANAGHVVLASASRHVFELNMALLVALFFFMSAAAHLFVATVYQKRYLAGLKQGINRVRWIEYSLSASTMMVAIGVLSGIYDLSTLVLIFVLNMVMNLLGLAMETYNKGKQRPNWIAYIVGCIAGIAPWIVFGIYVWGAAVYGGSIPGFVYGIYASIFVFFNCFAVNMYLQYKKHGKWASYLYGEKVYMILSLVAKTALAWQVFAGVLRP